MATQTERTDVPRTGRLAQGVGLMAGTVAGAALSMTLLAGVAVAHNEVEIRRLKRAMIRARDAAIGRRSADGSQ